MYTLKSAARRSSLLGVTLALVAAVIAPAASVFADALNPLTERSLTLSSSSPGWSYRDASGNATYAPPNSGANGNQTGNTFSFRVSSTASVEAFTFQYCTQPAGQCQGPGNNTGNGGTREANGPTPYAGQRSDLEVVTSSPSEVSSGNYASLFNSTKGQPSSALNVPDRDGTEGNYIVLHKAPAAPTWSYSGGWSMASSNEQDAAIDTNKDNYITLSNSTGQSLGAGDYVKIIFFGTDDNYITNPGSSAFFVKINTYSDDAATTVIDGGVTVANIMNRSIEIQTKVLETMDFSVGTVDPNTLDSDDPDAGGPLLSQFTTATGRAQHTPCDPIATSMDTTSTTPNVLQLGNEVGEFSLQTLHTYSTHSYWRLSSNSSAGATVYYSGVTLSNTVGDQIDAIGGGLNVATAPLPGSEQFGLALDNGSDTVGVGPHEVSYAKERTAQLYQNGADNDVTGLETTSLTADNVLSNGSWHTPRLFPLDPAAPYADGTGNVNSEYGTVNTHFAFDSQSNLIPTPIASENNQVVDCVTGKMRYIANIAATTPAGIYTTKINYIAAPQY